MGARRAGHGRARCWSSWNRCGSCCASSPPTSPASIAVLTLMGPQAAGAVPRGRRGRGHAAPLGTDLIVSRERLPADGRAGCRQRGAALAGIWAYEALRIAGRPARFGLDTDHRTIPHEVGWIETAVHLNKGCYRGQETVARVHNLGHPPRRLVFLHLDGSEDRLPAHGDPVSLGAGGGRGRSASWVPPRGTTSSGRSRWPWSSGPSRSTHAAGRGHPRRAGGHRAAGRRGERDRDPAAAQGGSGAAARVTFAAQEQRRSRHAREVIRHAAPRAAGRVGQRTDPSARHRRPVDPGRRGQVRGRGHRRRRAGRDPPRCWTTGCWSPSTTSARTPSTRSRPPP